VQATVSHLDGRGLHPYEITQLVTDGLAQPRFTTACTQRFRDSVLDFMVERVVKPAANFRQSYGMYPALELEGDWDEYTDLSAGVSGKCTSSYLCDLLSPLHFFLIQ
jgi:DNA-directed RNA polymerase III subunit RPC1